MGQGPILGGGGGHIPRYHPSGNFGHALMLLGVFSGHRTEM